MNFPSDLKYAKTHEWIREEDGLIVIGLTDFAQDQLGDIVFVGLPEVGDAVEVGDSFADVESVKAVSDIYSPVSGVVAEVNEELLDAPEAVNGDPYGAWLIKVKDVTDEEEGLLDADAYEAFCEAGGEA
jgi:glycine cleavage system H protein